MINWVIYIITFIIYSYSLYCISRELYRINGNNNYSAKQKTVRTSILYYFFALFILIPYWVYVRNGERGEMSVHRIDKDILLIVAIVGQVSTSITRLFRKERTGEDLKLNYRKEIKRVINMDFRIHKEFDYVAKKFVRDFGEDVTYIKENTLDLEAFKNLNKGQIKRFNHNSFLEKVSNDLIHEYIYHVESALIFGIHVHLLLSEKIEPIDNDLDLYIFIDGEMKKHVISVGETFVIKNNYKHGVIFTKANRIKLNWF